MLLDRRSFLAGSAALAVGSACHGLRRTQARIRSFALGSPALAWHSCTRIGDYVVVLGGQRYDGPATPARLARPDGFILDAAKGSLVRGFSSPTAHSHAGTCKLGDGVLVVGGMGHASGSFRSLDTARHVRLEDASVEQASIGAGTHDVEVAVFGRSEAIYFGGHEEQAASGRAGVVTLEGGKLALRPFRLTTPRVYAKAVGDGRGGIYAIGGMSYQLDGGKLLYSKNLATIERIDPSRARSLPSAVGLAVSRRYHSVRRIGTLAYVIGGTTNQSMGRGKAHAAVERFDLESGQIERLPDLALPRYHAQTSIVRWSNRTTIALAGGQSDDETVVREVELYDVERGTSEIVGTTRPCIDHDRISWCEGSSWFIVGGETEASAGVSAADDLIRIDFGAGAVCLPTG